MRGIFKKQSQVLCEDCNYSEKLELTLLRNIEDFSLLFPERKVNTSDILQWCGGIVNKKTIQRVLTKHFVRLEKGRATHYVASPK